MDSVRIDIEPCRASVTVHQNSYYKRCCLLMFGPRMNANFTQFLDQSQRTPHSVRTADMQSVLWIIANKMNMVLSAKTKLFRFLFKFQIACRNIKCMKWLYQIKMGRFDVKALVFFVFALSRSILFYLFVRPKIFARENSNNHNVLWVEHTDGRVLFVPHKIFTCSYP